jgi:hypothetical protein
MSGASTSVNNKVANSGTDRYISVEIGLVPKKIKPEDLPSGLLSIPKLSDC